MNTPKFTIAALGVAVTGTIGIAGAQATDIGKREFDTACAVCHGLSGKGNGPMADIFGGRLPDVTTMAARNNGVFPFARVQETIDGTRQPRSHGPREMPIWGQRYSQLAMADNPEYFGPFEAAAFARARILALTEYVHRLQAK